MERLTFVDKLEWGQTFSVSFSCTSYMYDMIREHMEEKRLKRSHAIRDLIKWGLIYISIREREKAEASAAKKAQEAKAEEPPEPKKKAKRKTPSKTSKSK